MKFSGYVLRRREVRSKGRQISLSLRTFSGIPSPHRGASMHFRLSMLLICAACSRTPVSVPETLPDADAGSDLGELVDESETTATDAANSEIDSVQDTLPDASTDASPPCDATSVALDFPDGYTPYWLSHDVDISNVGVLTTCGECSDPLMLVKPGDPPKGPTCTGTCPAPYACTCGACPWLQVPKMVLPREGAAGVWTGKEVLVFGGANSPCCGGTLPSNPAGWDFTAERWDPSGSKGFELIPLPFQLKVHGFFQLPSVWTRAFWTGKLAVVLGPKPFTFDPSTGDAVLLPDPGIAAGEAVLVGENLFWWGVEESTVDLAPQYQVPKIAMLSTKALKWTPVPLPPGLKTKLPHPWFAYPFCLPTIGDDVFIVDLPFAPSPATAKPHMLKFSTTQGAWTVEAEIPKPFPNRFGDMTLCGAFPDGIAVAGQTNCVSKSDFVVCDTVGSIWSKTTGSWTSMKDPQGYGVVGPGQTLWSGSKFLIFESGYANPIVPESLKLGGPFQPLQYDPYIDQWSYSSAIGTFKYNRNQETIIYTGSELLILGGLGGQCDLCVATERTGARLWLPANPTSTDFSGIFP